MNPDTIEDHMIRCTSCVDEAIDNAGPRFASDLQPDNSIIVGSGSDGNGAGAACDLDLWQHPSRRWAAIGRSARQRRNSRVTRGKPRALGGQTAVGCAGADGNPVLGVAVLSRKRN